MPTSRDAHYVNPVHKWSISYPTGWAIDTQDVAFVRLHPTGDLQQALVGIHAAAVVNRTPYELLELMLDAQRRSGQGVRELSRQTIWLADSIPALLVDTELGVGTVGRSRRLIAVADGIAYVIDAETYRDKWPDFEPHVVELIRSFRLERGRE